MIVVKLGGSLFEHPRLAQGLRAYLESLAPRDVLLVPGGGDFAERLRSLDRVHRLGEEASHWLAVQAMALSAAFVARLLDLPRFDSRIQIPDCLAFLQGDDRNPDALPHAWSVTADSIAARIAVVNGAERLILLKSLDIPPETCWVEAARRGWVDEHFPTAIAGSRMAIEAVNFARVLHAR